MMWPQPPSSPPPPPKPEQKPPKKAEAKPSQTAPAAAMAGGANQTALGFEGWNSDLSYFRNVNALNAVAHNTIGPGIPQGLLPANQMLYEAWHATSDLWALNQIALQQSWAGTIGRTAALGQAAATDVLLRPLSTIFR